MYRNACESERSTCESGSGSGGGSVRPVRWWLVDDWMCMLCLCYVSNVRRTQTSQVADSLADPRGS